MERLWAWKQIDAGLLLALLSLMVARDYLRTVTPPRPPGLSFEEEEPPSFKPTRYSATVGMCYVAAAVAGLLIALAGITRL